MASTRTRKTERRMARTMVLLGVLVGLSSVKPASAEADPGTAGGEASVVVTDTSRNAFGRPFPAMGRELWQPFRQGKGFFARPVTSKPGEVPGRLGGLGPASNAESCAGCHFKDGRGGRGAAEPLWIVRLSVPSPRGEVPEPTYGGQLQDRGPGAEGRLEVTFRKVPGTYGDGTTFELREPGGQVVEPVRGPLDEATRLSLRMPPALIGLGLLESVSEAQILAWADPEDLDGDGISGRPNRVQDHLGRSSLGRFGWKAGQPGLLEQNAAALAMDLGLTSALHPVPDPIPGHESTAPEAVEVSLAQLERLTLYTRMLAVPARRGVEEPAVRRGEALFRQFSCASCHRPHLETASDAVPAALAGRTIAPYTDLLLHDMGEGLADHRGEHLANGREWRTAPLWGLGLLEAVSGTVRLLHDGRARSLDEAILWHGGEAEAAREAFRLATAAERRDLLLFLGSL